MRNHNIIPYTKEARQLSIKLRKNMTSHELIFWKATKSSNLGVVMRRQMPVLDYVIDFYIKDIGLAIEIDGAVHNNNTLEDGLRQARIEELGIQFIRFTNEEIENHLGDVLGRLKEAIEDLK